MSVPSMPVRLSSRSSSSFHHQLYTASRSLDIPHLPTYEQWTAKKSPVGDYTGNVPTYQIVLDGDRVEDFGSETHLLNDPLEKCFGQKGYKYWAIWIQGDHLVNLCRSLRDEYGRLAKLSKEESNLALIDLWLERLLEELQRL